ncbi:HlyD family secretion protein [Pseudomonas fluorescens]|uniref:HlyD family secretion protein n=1 Tax=Pseudomonas fluorescens TaxID=294 RepID=UPI001CA8D36A|nr:HlyD family secretion protein [Pseudomonas fluorescens]
MSDRQQEQEVTAASTAADPTKKALNWVAVLILLSLVWYLLADRYTPYTQQARVQTFVVPVAAEVAGRVTKVNVRNNQDVKAGEVLFEVNPQQYQIAVDRARADLQTTRKQIGANTAGIDSKMASLKAAQANEVMSRKDLQRLERLYKEDPGTISLRRLEISRSTLDAAVANVAAARAEVERARETQGGSDDKNAQLLSAIANVDKAELDLANSTVRARSAGLVTDLRTDVGQFAAAGAPLMTLIAIHDVWVTADMTENNLGKVRPGTPVRIVLDSLPGTVFEGHVRSIGYGVSTGQSTPAGTLPTVQNSRDWLRPAQRFPVIIELAPGQLADISGIRVGGQAEVMAFPSEGNPLNLLGRLFLRVMSWMSYAY